MKDHPDVISRWPFLFLNKNKKCRKNCRNCEKGVNLSKLGVKRQMAVMKKTTFHIKKYAVRAFVAIGAALGLAACTQVKSPGPEKVYGPPTKVDTIINERKLVYGPPPVRNRNVMPDTTLAPQSQPDNKKDK